MFRPATIIEVPIKGPAVDDLATLKALILARRVVGWLPLDLAEPEAQAGRLVRVLPEWEVLSPELLRDLARPVPGSLRTLSL